MEWNQIFSFMLPKEDKFFPMIQDASKLGIQAAAYLMALLKAPTVEEREAQYLLLKECEVKSDEVINSIFRELNETFITPFDREDIHDLCESLDDVMDFMTSSGKRVVLFNPRDIPQLTIHLAENISRCCDAIDIAMKQLKGVGKHPKVALEQCKILHDLEHEADDVYESFVKDLFETEKDSIELIKKKEIMQELERTTDKAKLVGKILKTIIVKYA